MSQSTNDGQSAAFGVSTESIEDGQESSNDTSEGNVRAGQDIDPLPLDIVFDMLKNERRRKVLDYIRREEGPFTLSELAEHIAAEENDKEIAALNSSERKRVYVGLYQCHLPRMADADIVDFDRDRGTVKIGARAEQLYPYLNVDTEKRVRAHFFGGVAAIFGIGLLIGVLVPINLLTVGLPPALLIIIATVVVGRRLDYIDF